MLLSLFFQQAPDIKSRVQPLNFREFPELQQKRPGNLRQRFVGRDRQNDVPLPVRGDRKRHILADPGKCLGVALRDHRDEISFFQDGKHHGPLIGDAGHFRGKAFALTELISGRHFIGIRRHKDELLVPDHV